ncbi:MAG: hypothetical protein H6852_19775 [Geminicoccaceae bacterium]|nr:hypothetical protein [Geminicoccaceae bacterium]HRY26006.1 hypothetical protein [Geminicoccaceae bacterium]
MNDAPSRPTTEAILADLFDALEEAALDLARLHGTDPVRMERLMTELGTRAAVRVRVAIRAERRAALEQRRLR